MTMGAALTVVDSPAGQAVGHASRGTKSGRDEGRGLRRGRGRDDGALPSEPPAARHCGIATETTRLAPRMARAKLRQPRLIPSTDSNHAQRLGGVRAGCTDVGSV